MNARFVCAVIVALLALQTAGGARADWDAKHLKQVRSASTSLRAAVLTAERELKGKAYFALANTPGDQVTFTVRLNVNDKAMQAQVDGKSGKITESGSVNGETAVFLKEFAKLKGTLLAAMKAAESTAKGKSFQAQFKRLGNKDVFEVGIAGRDDVEKDVVVDAASGKIRKVAEKSLETGSATPAGGATVQ
jgi:uncharacterized membrane protein YkoI